MSDFKRLRAERDFLLSGLESLVENLAGESTPESVEMVRALLEGRRQMGIRAHDELRALGKFGRFKSDLEAICRYHGVRLTSYRRLAVWPLADDDESPFDLFGVDNRIDPQF